MNFRIRIMATEKGRVKSQTFYINNRSQELKNQVGSLQVVCVNSAISCHLGFRDLAWRQNIKLQAPRKVLHDSLQRNLTTLRKFAGGAIKYRLHANPPFSISGSIYIYVSPSSSVPFIISCIYLHLKSQRCLPSHLYEELLNSLSALHTARFRSFLFSSLRILTSLFLLLRIDLLKLYPSMPLLGADCFGLLTIFSSYSLLG